MTKKKAVLIFPDGVGIRNYLYSDVFKNTDAELILLHNFDRATEKLISEITGIKTFYKIPHYNESVREKFLREVICLSRLHYNAKINDNKTILSSWKINPKGVKNRIFYKLVSFFAARVKKYSDILKLEKAYQKSIRATAFYNEISQLFNQLNPDFVFCSHQRAIQCAPIFAVAADRSPHSLVSTLTSTTLHSEESRRVDC